MDVTQELATFVGVAEEVTRDCEEGAKCLDGDVPPGSNYLR